MELSHTLEVRPNLFIRAFVRFYEMSRPYDLNTCKLFWGTVGMIVIPPIALVFSPVLLVLWLLTKGLDALGAYLKSLEDRRTANYKALPVEVKEAKAAKKSRREEFLSRFSMRASMVWFKVQKPVTWFVRIVVGLAILAIFAFIAYHAIRLGGTVDWGEVFWTMLRIIAVAVTTMVAVAPIGWLILKWWVNRPEKPAKVKKPSVIKAMFRSVHDHTCANIKVVSDDIPSALAPE